jgi:hypothetical protein
MKNILGSATRIVLLLMIVGLLAFTAMGILDGSVFKDALLIVLTYYFVKKSEPVLPPQS